MADMKKELQKVIKAFRDEQKEASAYPKAMMTAQQMRKGTATINCGRSDCGNERSQKVLSYKPFIEWCDANGIKTCEVEIAQEASYMKPQYQIRVTY